MLCNKGMRVAKKISQAYNPDLKSNPRVYNVTLTLGEAALSGVACSKIVPII